MPISEQQRLSLLEDLLRISLIHHKEGKVKGLLNVPITSVEKEGGGSDDTLEAPAATTTTLLQDITEAVRYIDATRSGRNIKNNTTLPVVDTTAPPPSLTRAQVMEQQLFDRREDRRIIALGAVTFTESDEDSQNGGATEQMSNSSRPSSVAGSSRTVDDVFKELQVSGGGGASRRSYDENAYRNEEFFRTTSISPTALDNVGAFVVQRQRDVHRQKLGRVKEDAIQEAAHLWTATAAARIKRDKAALPPPQHEEEDQDGVVSAPDPSSTSPEVSALTTLKQPVPRLSAAQRKRRDQELADEKAVEDLMWDPSSAEIIPTVPTAHATKNRNAMLTQGYDPPDQVVITLLTGPVMHKPQGIEEKSAALKHQGYYCKSCLRSLKKSANPLRGWDAAVFCFYTGYYYCEQCHDRTQLSVIPARVVQDWDFSEHMVSSLSHTFLDIHRCQTPMLCVSAINPALYDKVWLLRMVRELRVELTALNAVGLRCKEFRKKFYSYGDAVIVPTRGGGGYTASGPRASALQSFRSRANSTTSDASFSSNRRMSVSSFSGMHLGIGTRSVRDLGGGAIGTGGGAGNLLFDADNDAYIPVYKRYLVMDSECWTLEDLEDMHQADPDNVGPELVKQWEDQNKKEMLKLQQKEEHRRRKAAKKGDGGNNAGSAMAAARVNTSDHHPLTAFAGLSPLVEELLDVRRWFLRHILKECVDQCLPSAVHACRGCSQSRGKDLIMSILPSASRCFHYCTQCNCYYHRACWKRLESEAQQLLHTVVQEHDMGSPHSDHSEDGGITVMVCPECRSDAARAAKLQRSRNLW